VTDPLRVHGDADARDRALLDFAVNVRLEEPPAWLRERIAKASLGRYPDDEEAVAAVARRHGRAPADVLLTAGAAEAFVLLARALRPAHAVCVHPSFTEPEAALRAAGHAVERAVLRRPFTFSAGDIPDTADLVVIGNPTNPTGILHAADALAGLCRPGRVVVVDEAFMDFVPSASPSESASASASLAGRGDLPGLVVVRSLTKMWGLAGLRVGYLLAPAALAARLRASQPLWPVSAPAIAAVDACMGAQALAEAQAAAREVAAERESFVQALSALGLDVSAAATANFVLARAAAGLRVTLRRHGIAVRRGDTFPGIGDDWIRIAVRDGASNALLLDVLAGLPDALRLPAAASVNAPV
jgi:histidinol-phosphate aminotransferase